MSEPAYLKLARTFIGQREVPGLGVNAWIKNLWAGLSGGTWFWNTYGKDDSKLPWCGAFVAYCLKQTGLPHAAKYASARAWETYGTALSKPKLGCIVVFTRSGGGHVGFVVGKDQRGFLQVLGGNQGDAVSIASFDPARVTAYRCPPGVTLTVDPPVKGKVADSKSEA